MSILQEFKAFAMRGNVIDLAVGVIIGAAFGKITTSLVEDVIMPPLGLLLGKVDFSEKFIALTAGKFPSLDAAREAGALVSRAVAKENGIATLNYGNFINVLLNFLIVAFAVFILIKQINALTKPKAEPAAAPTTKECPQCLSTIPIKATRCAHCTSQIG